jgi:5-methylcytosine-specific restriction endonuclease McrA
MSKKAAYTCEHCGKIFYAYPSNRTREHSFCCKKCYFDWMAYSKPKLEPHSPQWYEHRVAVQCEACGAIRWKTLSYAHKCKRHFCGPECHGSWLSRNRSGKNSPIYKRISVICIVCSKEIERPPHKIDRSDKHFCSRDCYAAWQSEHMQGTDNYNYNRIQGLCDECGADITVTPYQLSHFEYHFCNAQCRGAWYAKHITGENHPNWKGGYKDYYGPNWEAQRDLARQRDKYRCRICGVTEKRLGRELDVHHIIPFRTFGYIAGQNEHYKEANDLSNLIALCPRCHKYAEAGRLPVQMRLF